MLNHSSRRLGLPGFGLLVLSLVAVSACGAGSGSSGELQTPPGTLTPVASAAAPATAAVPSATSATPVGAHKGKAAHGANATHNSAASPLGVPSKGAITTLQSAAATTGNTVYGISDPTLLNESTSVQVQQLEAMKALGATSVRLDANWYWGQLNGAGSSFVWTPIDQAVASIQQAGLSADLVIDGCPPWAAVAGAEGSEFAQPASPAAFATWAGAVAARYADKGVKFFEIWNEPNINWAPKPDPAAYTADLKAAYAAIKEADPSAVVLSGGLAPAANTSTTYDPRTFLEDMYADGAKGSFNGVGDHPYSFPAPPDEYESWSGWSQLSQTGPSLRSIMVQNGDSAKKIYITEYGARTSGSNSVSESEQSTELVQAIAQVKNLSFIGSLYIYTWADVAGEAATDDGYGLLTEQNTQKLAYASVAAALAST